MDLDLGRLLMKGNVQSNYYKFHLQIYQENLQGLIIRDTFKLRLGSVFIQYDITHQFVHNFLYK
jgi:hypothetical protein